MRVVISGLYAGPNPSPGVTLAQCVRSAFPNAHIIGVDYTDRHTGLHWPGFDEIEIQRPWNQLETNQYAEYLKERLSGDTYWISGLDLEIHFLAEKGFDTLPGALVPSLRALEATDQMNPRVLDGLSGTYAPETLSIYSDDWEMHRFLRLCGWRAWLKGPQYEALPIRSWADVEPARRELTSRWGEAEFFLQRHVAGNEECLAFSAYRGELLGAVRMEKYAQTREGKTWAGRVTEPDPAALEWLARTVAELEWTGGGEFEFVRDVEDRLALIELNPRFGAWIGGAVFAGVNLPGLLLERASGERATHCAPESEYFARVVVEMPCRPDFPLPPPRPITFGSSPSPGKGATGKAPSGVVELAGQLQVGGGPSRNNGRDAERWGVSSVAPRLLTSLAEQTAALEVEGGTPRRVLLVSHVAESFEASAASARRASTKRCAVRLAYSFKTNPDPRLLALALKHGFAAEVISNAELEVALATGFDADNVVFNGPAKEWPCPASPGQLGARSLVYADSPEELNRTIATLETQPTTDIPRALGLRLRPPRSPSRFGIDVGDFATFDDLAHTIAESPATFDLAMHFHLASHSIGPDGWREMLGSVLRWASALERTTGRAVTVLDLGGGWFPDDWRDILLPGLPALVETCVRALPRLSAIYFEPGRALSQESAALLMRVLDVRRAGQFTDVVVDASIAEIPNASHYPHRLLRRDETGSWTALRKGTARVLGRLCMEEDVLSYDADETLQEGDVIAALDCGAYDVSMSYAFGLGANSGA
jgi:diaminopimelate decarboxylase